MVLVFASGLMAGYLVLESVMNNGNEPQTRPLFFGDIHFVNIRQNFQYMVYYSSLWMGFPRFAPDDTFQPGRIVADFGFQRSFDYKR